MQKRPLQKRDDKSQVCHWRHTSASPSQSWQDLRLTLSCWPSWFSGWLFKSSDRWEFTGASTSRCGISPMLRLFSWRPFSSLFLQPGLVKFWSGPSHISFQFPLLWRISAPGCFPHPTHLEPGPSSSCCCRSTLPLQDLRPTYQCSSRRARFLHKLTYFSYFLNSGIGDFHPSLLPLFGYFGRLCNQLLHSLASGT